MICRPPPSGIHNTGGSPQPSEAEAAMAIGGALPEKNAILEKNAERKTSLEQASFDPGQIGSRVFAKTPLLSARFLSLLELSPQVTPAQIIPGPQLLHRKNLLFAGDCGHYPNRATNHHAGNSSSPTGGAPLMNACHAETMLQIIVGARETRDVITLKQPHGEVLSDVAKVLKRLRKRPQSQEVLPHLCQMRQVLFANPLPGIL